MPDLFERIWPVDGAKAGVVLVHGLGEHIGRYKHVAAALNAAGYSAYGRDIRGHGQSVGAPGDMGGDANRLVADLVEYCVHVKGLHEKVFLLAHSMGTMVALPSVTRVPQGTLAGLVLSGTALDTGPAGGDLVTKGAVPVETLSRDEAVQKAYEDDPLVWDKVPPEIFGAALEVGQMARDAVPLLNVPLLLVHGVDDQLTLLSGAQYVHTEAVVTDKTLIPYEGLRHEIFNEPEQDKVLGDVIAWLDKH